MPSLQVDTIATLRLTHDSAIDVGLLRAEERTIFASKQPKQQLDFVATEADLNTLAGSDIVENGVNTEWWWGP